MKKTLRDIGEELMAQLEEMENYCIENETDEVPEEILIRFSLSKENEIEKMNGYRAVLRKLSVFIKNNDEEAKFYMKRKKAYQKQYDWLSQTLGDYLILHGRAKGKSMVFEDPDGLFKLSASRTNRVKIIDDALVPDEFKEEVTSIKVDRKALGDALKQGELIEGAFLDTSNIQIRGIK